MPQRRRGDHAAAAAPPIRLAVPRPTRHRRSGPAPGLAHICLRTRPRLRTRPHLPQDWGSPPPPDSPTSASGLGLAPASGLAHICLRTAGPPIPFACHRATRTQRFHMGTTTARVAGSRVIDGDVVHADIVIFPTYSPQRWIAEPPRSEPDLRREGAHICHICACTGLTPATSVPGRGSPRHIRAMTGADRQAALHSPPPYGLARRFPRGTHPCCPARLHPHSGRRRSSACGKR
jgi:hypothetical protein